ncbi:MAG: hypothetical protein C0404_13370, partial [Verrucomicrobia bacterium]|nr:hypothetical protein [Verrucomicrobiota bacterium]
MKFGSFVFLCCALRLALGTDEARGVEEQTRSGKKVAIAASVVGETSPGGGTVILNEGSVWRTHVTWKKPCEWDGTSLKDFDIWGGIPVDSPPPPESWMKPEFDDSSWGYWRETCPVQTLKVKDGKDTGVRLYEFRQYGIQMSSQMGLRCLRGRFVVEDPAAVRNLSLSLAYRGGVVVYLNGQEVGRGHVPKAAGADRACPAEPYPEEIHYGPDGKHCWSMDGSVPAEAEALKKFNLRIRESKFSIPAGAIRKGVNVLAVEVHRAPYSAQARKADRNGGNWSACGLATLELRGDGAVSSAAVQPKGIQVWSPNMLVRTSPHGTINVGRIYQGGNAIFCNLPLTWGGESGGSPGPIRICGTRNGVFCGQAVVSSTSPIRGLRAAMGELLRKGGGGKLPISACRVWFQVHPAELPAAWSDPGVSAADLLSDAVPVEVPVTPARARSPFVYGRVATMSWSEGSAMASVWLWVRIPADAAPGEYEGKLTVTADGTKATEVPVRLSVQDFALPEPRDWLAHVCMPQSPDTLALKYKVPMWSEPHFKLIDKSFALVGELGGKAVFIRLAKGDVWPGGREMVGPGNDFGVMERYLDVALKHLKIEAVILNVGPVTGGPDAAAWKPVMDGAIERLKKRGLGEKWYLGTIQEGGRYDGDGSCKQCVETFKQACPEGKWTDLAHYAANKANIQGVPWGYAMSVWGNATP